jgi:hypothetical protein
MDVLVNIAQQIADLQPLIESLRLLREQLTHRLDRADPAQQALLVSLSAHALENAQVLTATREEMLRRLAGTLDDG